MVLSAKIRIYPTKSQEKILAYYCDCSHFMWNYMVEKFSNTDIIFGKYTAVRSVFMPWRRSC